MSVDVGNVKLSLGERLMIQSNEKAGDYIIKTATQDISVCSYAMKVTPELHKLFGANFAENKEKNIDWSRYNYNACKLIILHAYEILDLVKYNKLAPIELYFHDAITLAQMYGLNELKQELLDFIVPYCGDEVGAEFKFYENVKRDKMDPAIYESIVSKVFQNVIAESYSYKDIMEDRTELLFKLLEAKNEAAVTLLASQIKSLNNLAVSELVLYSKPGDGKTMDVGIFPDKRGETLIKKFCALDAEFKKQVTEKDNFFTLSCVGNVPNMLGINKVTFFAKKNEATITGRDGAVFHTIIVYYQDNA